MFICKICKVTNLLFLPLFFDLQNKEFSLFFILLQQILDIKSAGGKLYLERPKRLWNYSYSYHDIVTRQKPQPFVPIKVVGDGDSRNWWERYTNHQNLFAEVSKCYYMFE